MEKTILYGNVLNYHPNTNGKSITWNELSPTERSCTCPPPRPMKLRSVWVS